MSPAKPLPLLDDDTRAYWAGLARGELLLQHCLDCWAVQFYQRGMCGRCLGPRIEHRAASGRGSVYSFSTVYRAPSAEFKDDVPYTVVLVALTWSGRGRGISRWARRGARVLPVERDRSRVWAP